MELPGPAFGGPLEIVFEGAVSLPFKKSQQWFDDIGVLLTEPSIV